MNNDPSIATLATAINKGVDSRLKDLHTSMPGIVQSFDAETQLASVQPAIKRIFKTDEGDKELLIPTALPILINVPVQFPRGGGFSLTFPVQKGDECLLVFCERSIDSWHKFGGVKDPSARRFHSLSDATAFVGISSAPNVIPDYDADNVQLKKDDGSVKLTLLDNGTINVDANTTINMTAPNIILNGNTTINGTVTATGTATAPTVAATGSLQVAGKEIGGHTHSGSPTAPTGAISNTGAPV